MSTSSTSSPVPVNRLITYLRMLQHSKTGLPHGQLVCVSASHSIASTDALLQLASAVGPHIAILQIHADIIDDWSAETVHQLTILAKKHGFLLWEGGRVLNPYINSVGKPEPEYNEQTKESVESIRRTYTKGVVSMASWAGLATAWASGVTADNQEADILIPVLKSAARETVAGIAQTIKTEITAEGTASEQQRGDDSADSKEECDYGLAAGLLSPDDTIDNIGLGAAPRKSSTISLTQTISQHTEQSVPSTPGAERRFSKDSSVEDALLQFTITADDLSPPPLLVRGLVVCLPSSTNTLFTRDYRRSCLAAARANRDFVIGFLYKEPWTLISQRDDVLDSQDRSISKTSDSREESNERGLDGQQDSFVVFSPISDAHAHHKTVHDKSGNIPLGQEDEMTSPTTGTRLGSISDVLSPQASRLHAIVEQAIATRDAFSSSDENNARHSGRRQKRANILHVPIVKLGL